MIKELIDAGLVKPCTDKAGNIIAYYMVDLDSEEFINSTIEENKTTKVMYISFKLS